VFNNVVVTAYFSTGLAISLIRESMAKCLQCVRCQCRDKVFTDPVTARVFLILWEIRLFVNYGNNSTTTNMYVVADCEIGFPVILGMDTLLALGMQIIVNEARRMNPLYPNPGENWPILSTGFTMSLASPKWFQGSRYPTTQTFSS
jgi:hypothetical protein